ncbi:latent-transforming growth factor beta-binding protein 2-like protein, partial [Lates japonicus]
MQLSLLCVWTSWILTVHTAAQHQPHRDQEGVRPGRTRLDTDKPPAVRETGERLRGGQAGRRAALTGPHVCGGRCCVGWTLSPKTRRCTKPRCFPPCHNGALCRHPNRCVCRRGFHGSRCEFSTVTFSLPGRPLTSIHPTVNPLHTPPRPTVTPQRNTKPAQRHVIAARSGPAAVLPPPASTRATRITNVTPRPKPRASDLNPPFAPAKTHKEEDAKFGLKTEGFQKRFPVQEENQASLKNEEVKMKPTPEFNDLQPRTGDTEDQEGAAEITGKTPNLKSDSEPEVRCSQDRCVNYCERGNMTTLYSSNSEGAGGGGRRDSSHGPGFTVFLCPLLCKNGGVCLQKDRCLCPPNFTGKFCQIPVTPTSAAAAPAPAAAASPSSTNEIVKPALLSPMAANQELTQSEFLLPLGQNQEAVRSGAPGPSMVKVRVQHPPEASVKIHQVVKSNSSCPAGFERANGTQCV